MDNSFQREKVSFVALAKGLAVYFMLWGHCIQYCSNNRFDIFDNKAFQFIYSFHMPLFMLISGFLFYYSYKKRDLKELIANRTNRLLYPIITWSFISYYLTTGINSLFSSPNVYALFSGAWLDNLPSLWFLWSALVCSLVTVFVMKNNANIGKRIALALVSFGFALVMPCATTSIYMLPYFVAGFLLNYLLDQHPRAFNKLITVRFLSLIIFPILLLFYSREHFIYTTGLYTPEYSVLKCILIDFFRWIIGFAGSAAVLTLLYEAKKYFINTNRDSRVIHFIENMGNSSLEYYCISVVILSFYLRPIFLKITTIFGFVELPDYRLLYDFIITPVIAIVYCLVIHLINKFLIAIKVHDWIFGFRVVSVSKRK